jgi:hypothetical protein
VLWIHHNVGHKKKNIKLLEEEIARGFGDKDLGHLTHLQKVERGLFVSDYMKLPFNLAVLCSVYG